MPIRIRRALAVIGLASMIGSANAENTVPVPDIIHDHKDLRLDPARWNDSGRFTSATPRDVEGTAEIAVECLPNNDLMSMIFIPGLQLEPENVRALSVHSDNRRTQFSVRALRENNDAPILVDYDHLRAKPKRTRRFVETLWTGNGATLQLGKRSWRFDPSSSRVGLFLVADVCGVALSWHSVDINSQSSWIDGAVRHDPFHRTGCCRAFGRLKQGHPQPTDQHHERVDQNHVVKLHLLREPTDSILCMRSGGIT